MKWLAQEDGRALPPQPGDQWRIDRFRFNKYKTTAQDTDLGVGTASGIGTDSGVAMIPHQ